MKSLITTGGNGLVGSRITELLGDEFSFNNLDLRSDPAVDITNETAVTKALAQSSAEWVIHLAAITDVTKAHEENGDTNGLTYRVNVLGTRAVANACKSTGKKLLHISTAYVFNGEKNEAFTEEDEPSPIEWYGETKAMAEAVVLATDMHSVILRIDNPFRSTPFEKQDIVQRIAQKLMTGTLPPQFSDSHFGPTYIEDTARIIRWILRSNARGLYHATNNESWTPFEFAKLVANRVGKQSEVREGSLTEFLTTTARPYQRNTALNCKKLLAESGLHLTPIVEAVQSVELANP